ncbi:MAG: type transport system permease protein [Thermotoga sp.]|nr:type transport system permease protein [Thermotoga sp.]
MRELFVLMKYANPQGKKGLYAVLFTALMMGVLFYSLMGKTFEELLNRFGEEVFVASLTFSTTLFSMMFLLGISFYLSHSLVLEEEIEFLLTLPIRRSTVVIYQMLMSLFYQAFVLITMFLNLLMLSFLTRDPVPVLSGILHLFFLVFLGSALSIALGRILNRSMARRLSSVVQLLAVFGFLVIVNVPDFATVAGRFIVSKWNILAYPVLSHVRSIFLIHEALLVVLSFLAFYLVSQKAAFEPVAYGKREEQGKKRFPGRGFFKKDLITLFREERMVYFLFYPVGFGVLMTIVGSADFGLIFAVGISALYNATMTAMLWRKELEVWPLPRIFPVRLKDVVLSKVLVPSFLNTAVVSGYVIFLVFYQRQFLYLSFVPVCLSLYLFVSVVGLFLSKWEETGQLANPAKVFSTPVVLLVQLLALGVVAALGYVLSLGSHLLFALALISVVVGSIGGFAAIFKRFVARVEKFET